MHINLTKLSAYQLTLSNIHVGHSLSFLRYEIKPYLQGKRGGVSIFNLTYTQLQIKMCINFVSKIIAKRQKILILKENDFFKTIRLFESKKFARYLIYYDQKWIGGVLTNFKVIRQCPKLLQQSPDYTHVRYMAYFPSFMFTPDTNVSKWFLYEAYNLQIPSSSIIDTNSEFFHMVNYPIMGNNKSYESIYFFLHIMRNTILRGMQRECLKLLRLKK